jgi:hypothetical protein
LPLSLISLRLSCSILSLFQINYFVIPLIWIRLEVRGNSIEYQIELYSCKGCIIRVR